jgi:hypothetical protein
VSRRARRPFLTTVWEGPTSPPSTRGEAQVVKLAGRRTRRPERVVRADGLSGDATAGGGCAGGGTVVEVPCFVFFIMNAGMTLPAETVIVLPCTEQLERLVSAFDDSVRTAVRRIQCTVRCVLSQKDLCRVF